MTAHRRAQAAPAGRRRSPLVTALRWTSGLVLVVAVLGVVVLSLGTFTGRLAIQTVPTGSMEPTIHEGSAIVVDPIAVDDIAVGDVIVFASPTTQAMTVHRVVAIDHDDLGPIFTTKGDANVGPDPWNLRVDGDHLHRVRTAVPVLGSMLLSLSAPSTRMALAGVGALLVLGFGLTHVWRRPDATAAAPATWDAVLHRVATVHTEAAHGHHGHGPKATPELPPDGDPTGHRALDPLLALLRDAAPGAPAPGAALPRRRVATAGATTLVALVVLAGVGSWFPIRSASATLTAATGTAGSLATKTVPTKGDVRCRWDPSTAITVSWTNPNATDAARLLVAASPGGATTVAASAPAGTTSSAITLPDPLTTVRHLSTESVSGTWSSTPSPPVATNDCHGAVRLFAGGGQTGYSGDGGPAVDAGLNSPTQTAEGPDGRVYVAGSDNDRIRVIGTDGIIQTFAGGGSNRSCSYTGPAAGVRLDGPTGVAVDGAGNVYIADTGNDCVRRVDPSGSVSRIAGGGNSSSCNGATTPATSLSLSAPAGLVVDPTGALIVVDSGRDCVRRISGGTATRVAGGGSSSGCGTTTSSAVGLSDPIGVAVDGAGDVYVADTGNDCVRKVSGSTVTAVAGGGRNRDCAASTTSTALRLSSPEGVAVAADGTVYISDTVRRCIRQVSGTSVLPLAFTGSNGSSGDDGPALEARIRTPGMITVLADGDLLVPDRATNNNASDIRRIELS